MNYINNQFYHFDNNYNNYNNYKLLINNTIGMNGK